MHNVEPAHERRGQEGWVIDDATLANQPTKAYYLLITVRSDQVTQEVEGETGNRLQHCLLAALIEGKHIVSRIFLESCSQQQVSRNYAISTRLAFNSSGACKIIAQRLATQQQSPRSPQRVVRTKCWCVPGCTCLVDAGTAGLGAFRAQVN